MNGCNGKCCESFPMVGWTTFTHAQVIAERDAAQIGILHTPEQKLEYDKYVDMLIVIGSRPVGGDLFTCRYHDPVTKLCTVNGRELQGAI